jgi:hypothetical protein
MTTNDQLCTDAHTHASKHRAELDKSGLCGCFFCFRTFPTSAITSWIDAQKTALCPKCGIDSVLGSASGHSIEDRFLRKMHQQYFGYRSR